MKLVSRTSAYGTIYGAGTEWNFGSTSADIYMTVSGEGITYESSDDKMTIIIDGTADGEVKFSKSQEGTVVPAGGTIVIRKKGIGTYIPECIIDLEDQVSVNQCAISFNARMDRELTTTMCTLIIGGLGIDIGTGLANLTVNGLSSTALNQIKNIVGSGKGDVTRTGVTTASEAANALRP